MHEDNLNQQTIAEGFKGEKAIVTPYSIREYQRTNPATSGLYVTHIGYYPKARFHYRRRDNGANENILILCQSGKGWIELDGIKHNISPNDFCIIPARKPHIYGADRKDPWSIYWIHFEGSTVERYNTIMERRVHLDDRENSRQADRLVLFESMFRNLEMGYAVENLEYISSCLQYFLASLKYVSQYRMTNNVKMEDVVERCIMYMKENLENKTTLNDIANTVGYSPSHLTSLFIKKTSYSPIVYFNQLRIQRSCMYLQFTDLKIKEIAFRLEYYDPFHFTKAFIKEMGITPSEYRKRYNEKYLTDNDRPENGKR